MFEDIIKQIEKSENFVIFPHTNMDGDSTASSKALCLALNKLGKKAVIFADEKPPLHVSFLDYELFLVNGIDAIPFDNYFAFAVDCSDNIRIENRIDVWNNASCRLCIDHHIAGEKFADYIYRDADAPAAAILVYQFIKELGKALFTGGDIVDKEIAEAAFTGILTDTGGFRYSNTGSLSHLIAAELINYGIDTGYICNHVFDNKPLEQFQIESCALNNSKFFENGRIVISYVDYDCWNSKNVPYSFTESSIDVLRSISGVEIAAILKEKEPGLFKLSMRSKDYADVSIIAKSLGGGGHKKAAAATMQMSLSEAIAILEKELPKVL